MSSPPSPCGAGLRRDAHNLNPAKAGKNYGKPKNTYQFQEDAKLDGEDYRNDGGWRILHQYYATEPRCHRFIEIGPADAVEKSLEHLFQKGDGIKKRKKETRNGR